MSLTGQHQTGARVRPTAAETAAHLGDSARALVVALAHVQEGVALINPNGVVTFANASFARLSGLRQGDLVGRSLRHVLSPDAGAPLLERASRATEEAPIVFEAHASGLFGRATGSDPLLRLRATPCFNAQGGLQQLVLLVEPRDDTAAPGSLVRSARAARLEPQQLFAIGARLATELAHDLNNELSVLLNYCFVALRRVDGAEPVHGHLEEIRRAGWRASRLAQRLFSFGSRNTDVQDFEIENEIRQMAIIMRLFLAGQRALELDIHGAEARVRAPLARVEQLLLHAALMARDVPSDLGPLRVSVEHCGPVAGRPPAVAVRIGPVRPEPPLPESAESDEQTGDAVGRMRIALAATEGQASESPGPQNTVFIELRLPKA